MIAVLAGVQESARHCLNGQVEEQYQTPAKKGRCKTSPPLKLWQRQVVSPCHLGCWLSCHTVDGQRVQLTERFRVRSG